MEGQLREGMAPTDEAYRIVREIGEAEVADSISRFASILVHAGKAEAAMRVLSCSETLREELGIRRSWVLERNEETLDAIRGQLDETAFAEAWEQGRKLTPDEAVALAREAFAGGLGGRAHQPLAPRGSDGLEVVLLQ